MIKRLVTKLQVVLDIIESEAFDSDTKLAMIYEAVEDALSLIEEE